MPPIFMKNKGSSTLLFILQVGPRHKIAPKKKGELKLKKFEGFIIVCCNTGPHILFQKIVPTR